jgi:hypothetical protein
MPYCCDHHKFIVLKSEEVETSQQFLDWILSSAATTVFLIVLGKNRQFQFMRAGEVRYHFADYAEKIKMVAV